MKDIHIDGRKAAMGDGAADGARKGESGVEVNAGQLLGCNSSVHLLLCVFECCTHLGGG